MKEEPTTISSDENKVYIASKGKVIVLESPESGHGEHQLFWRDGKVDRVITQESKKI